MHQSIIQLPGPQLETEPQDVDFQADTRRPGELSESHRMEKRHQ